MRENGKRSRMEILVDILNVTKFGALKSHIVYQANLNFRIIEGYLDSLMDDGLLVKSTIGKRIYTTTERGHGFIEHYNGFCEFISL